MSNGKDQQETLTDAVLVASLQEQKMKGPNLRQLHSKSHGLVSGKFTIEENIPEQCKVGVFAKPQEYDIWVRFSNASSPKALNELKPDTEGDARGMAIKLKNVEGNQVHSDETDAQDFVLINHHVFFLPDVQGYIDLGEFRKAMAQKIPPAPELAQKLAPSLAIAEEMNRKIVGNSLCIQYWSTTPYKLGSHFIKFSVKPHELEATPSSLPDSPNYLREAMVKHLTEDQKQSAFDFLVQFYVDEAKTPIENPMQEWKEVDSPFIKVATIMIPPQEFDSVKCKELDESLSFNPWHTLPEHEPVGSINLSRRRIYQEVAKARR
jgi:Catalase